MPITPQDAQGTLSSGTGLNYLFDSPRVGDIATFNLVCDEGKQDPSFTLPGVAGIALSADGVTYGADGADLAGLAVTSSGVAVWAKCASVQTAPLVFLIDSSGLEDIASGDVIVNTSLLALTASLFAPTVTTTQSVTIGAELLSLTLSLHAPTVDVAGNTTVDAALLTATLTLHEPTTTATVSVTTSPSLLTLASTLHEPTVSAATNVTVAPDALGLTVTLHAPTASATSDTTVSPAALGLTLALYEPSVTAASPPAQVTGVSLTPHGTSIDATWSVPSGTPTGYDVQYKATASGTWLDLSPDPTTNSATITGLSSSTSHDVRIRAYNSGGTGDFSTTTTTTTTVGPVANGTYYFWPDEILRTTSTTGTVSGLDTIKAGEIYAASVVLPYAVVEGTSDATAPLDWTFTVPTGGINVIAFASADTNFYAIGWPDDAQVPAGKTITLHVNWDIGYDADTDSDTIEIDFSGSYVTVS